MKQTRGCRMEVKRRVKQAMKQRRKNLHMKQLVEGNESSLLLGVSAGEP
jgi:hypothetical protein